MKTFFLLVISISVSIACHAQNNDLKKLEEQRKQALIEITNTSKLLNDTKKNTSSLLSRINLLSDQILSRQKVLQLLESELTGISNEQIKNEKEIAILEQELKEKQKQYAHAVEAIMHNRTGDNKLLFILSGRSFSESYRRLRYLREYSAWRSSQADEIKDKNLKLKEKKLLLAKTKSSKLALLKQREYESAKLKVEETSFQNEVKEAQKQQKELQKTLALKRQQADALNKKIERLIIDEVKRQEREAERKNKARAEAEKRAKVENKAAPENKAASENKTNTPTISENKPTNSETTETSQAEHPITITKEDFKLSSDFAANKGALPFPVTGAYTISNRFGVHKHNQWNVNTSSNGIIIKAQAGAKARAVFDGVVTSIFAVQGYYNNILVRHGNYYTVYSNIQNLYIKLGDTVTTGQALGVIYNDPDTGISETDFQLYQGRVKIDPEPWLKK